jgi:hypothetical protein
LTKFSRISKCAQVLCSEGPHRAAASWGGGLPTANLGTEWGLRQQRIGDVAGGRRSWRLCGRLPEAASPGRQPPSRRPCLPGGEPRWLWRGLSTSSTGLCCCGLGRSPGLMRRGRERGRRRETWRPSRTSAASRQRLREVEGDSCVEECRREALHDREEVLDADV